MVTIWFDMDGTIADFYGVHNWLEYLNNSDPTPYRIAKPRINMQVLARILHKLQKQGYKIGIVSWLSKYSDNSFDAAVTSAKLQWLKSHLTSVRFDKVDIIPYGTPKQNGRNGILFDDEVNNRKNWNGQAYDVDNILEVLKTL